MCNIGNRQVYGCELTEGRWRIYASLNCAIIGSGNGLLPDRRQSITWISIDLSSIKNLWNKLQLNFDRKSNFPWMYLNVFENVVYNVTTILSRP